MRPPGCRWGRRLACRWAWRGQARLGRCVTARRLPAAGRGFAPMPHRARWCAKRAVRKPIGALGKQGFVRPDPPVQGGGPRPLQLPAGAQSPWLRRRGTWWCDWPCAGSHQLRPAQRSAWHRLAAGVVWRFPPAMQKVRMAPVRWPGWSRGRHPAPRFDRLRVPRETARGRAAWLGSRGVWSPDRWRPPLTRQGLPDRQVAPGRTRPLAAAARVRRSMHLRLRRAGLRRSAAGAGRFLLLRPFERRRWARRSAALQARKWQFGPLPFWPQAVERP